MTGTRAGADLVVALVSDTWSDAVRRGFYSTADQFLLSALDDDRVRRMLVADHPRGVTSQVPRRLSGDRPAPSTAQLAGTRPLCLVTPPPAAIAQLVRRYRAYDVQVAVAARRARLHRPAMVTFNLWHAALAPRGRWADTVFYAQDDEAAIPHKSHQRELIVQAYRRIAASGMTVVAVSQVLLDRIAPTGPGLVIPNGVDDTLWLGPVEQPRPPSPRPRVVYAGTVDSRLDTDAVRQLAAAGYAVTLMGPVRDAATSAALAGVANVELTGTRSRADVVSALRHADVCLLAHRRTPLTEAMSPLKYAEYLASGTPVVATRLPGLEGISTAGNLVDPGGDYVAAVARALRQPRLTEAQRQVQIEALSWRRRHRPLLDIVTASARPGVEPVGRGPVACAAGRS